MKPDATTYLETFERPVARAVASVLRRAGVPAVVNEVGGPLPGMDGDEAAVFVPQGRREEAMTILLASMEEIRDEAAQEPSLGRTWRVSRAHPMEDEEDGPPIVMERFRRMGFIALMLAPLMVVTLSGVRLPLAYALALFVGGMVAVSAWRNRHTPDA